MKSIKSISFLCVFFILALMPLSSLTVKLGSVIPAGSDWDLALKELANEWREITEGRVNIKIYPGGIAGSEDNMIRKMRIGQLDMAMLSAIGLNKIVPETFVLSLPFLFENDDEVKYMIENMTPTFEDDFEEKGFKLLIWSSSGWIRFFSKSPGTSPSLLKKQKMAVSGNEPEMMNAWKKLNFHVIPISINETLSGLQSGMIDAYYAPPIAAAAYQWFALTPHMNEIPIAPLIGGIVISTRTWKKIPSHFHKELQETVSNANAQFDKFSKQMDYEALKVMSKHGLQKDSPSDDERDEWDSLFGKDFSGVVGPGRLVPTEILDIVYEKLDEFRENR